MSEPNRVEPLRNRLLLTPPFDKFLQAVEFLQVLWIIMLENVKNEMPIMR